MLDPASQDAFAACRETVRLGDKDRYLALLFAPESLQPPFFAIAAFADAELARIPSLVSESPIGEIRLQWWADTLAATGERRGRLASRGAGSRGDRCRQLAPTGILKRHGGGPPLRSLRRRDAGYRKRGGLFRRNASALIQLSCMVIDQTAAPKAASAAGFAGAALGLARARLPSRTAANAGSRRGRPETTCWRLPTRGSMRRAAH